MRPHPHTTHFEAPEDLVDQELHMIIGERLLFDNVIQIRAHQVSHKVSAHITRHQQALTFYVCTTVATHTSWKSSMLTAGVNTSNSPMICNGSKPSHVCTAPPTCLHTCTHTSSGAHIFMFHVLEITQLSVSPLGMYCTLKRPS